MPYADHFALADDLIQHLDAVLGPPPRDPLIERRYTGFLAVSAVAVLELAVKTIFIEFAGQKHRVFGHFFSKHFERINGRIALDTIKKDYVAKCGPKYAARFKRSLEQLERRQLVLAGFSVKVSYSNLLEWRNEVAHAGQIPMNATYAEVKAAYTSAKDILQCLATAMRR